MTQTSNGPAIKAALIAALSDAPGLDGVDVGYSWTQAMGRECIYGGAVSVEQSISSGRDAEGNVTRDEDVTVNLHIRVSAIGDTNEAAELRAIEIGAALETYLALHMPDLPGLLTVDVTGYDLASSFDDDGAFALCTYPVRAKSYLS